MIFWLGLTALWLFPGIAWGAQVHAAPEGLYAHQIGHLIFLLALGILIYWLRCRRLTHNKGWLRLQYAALFFALWNVDAFIAHVLESRPPFFVKVAGRSWHVLWVPNPGHQTLTLVYYLIKMDHLLCVPAIIFLYLALRELANDTHSTSQGLNQR